MCRFGNDFKRKPGFSAPFCMQTWFSASHDRIEAFYSLCCCYKWELWAEFQTISQADSSNCGKMRLNVAILRLQSHKSPLPPQKLPLDSSSSLLNSKVVSTKRDFWKVSQTFLLRIMFFKCKWQVVLTIVFLTATNWPGSSFKKYERKFYQQR